MTSVRRYTKVSWTPDSAKQSVCIWSKYVNSLKVSKIFEYFFQVPKDELQAWNVIETYVKESTCVIEALQRDVAELKAFRNRSTLCYTL